MSTPAACPYPGPPGGAAPDSGAPDPDAHLQDILNAVLVVAQGLDLSTTLRRIVTSAMTLVDARYGAVGVSGDTGGDGSLQEFIYVGVDAETAAAIGDPPCGKGLLGYLLDVQKPVRLAELSEHPMSVGFPENHPSMHSFLGAPIMINNALFGCIYLSEKADGQPFAASDERAIEVFAAAAAVAVDNAQMHAEALRHQERLGAVSLLEERERIGRDLHDQVIQRIFAAGLGLQVVRSQAVEEPVRERLDSVIGELDRTIADIRSTIFELSTEESGLRSRMVRVCRSVARGSDLAVDVAFSGPVEEAVTDSLARDVEAVVTEGVSNAVRHSHGSRVSVTVLARGAEVTVEIVDDGIGVPEGGRRSGLRNMATRAELRGGSCVTEPDGATAPGGRPGTVLRWTVPRP